MNINKQTLSVLSIVFVVCIIIYLCIRTKSIKKTDSDFTLHKAAWCLQLLNHMSHMESRPPMIAELDEIPSLTVLRNEYAARNRSLLVRAKRGGNPAGWPIHKWTLDFLLERYGSETVNVQSGRDTDAKYEENSGLHRVNLKMTDFIHKLRHGPINGHYMTANNAANNRKLINKLLSTLPNLGPVNDPILDLPKLTTSGFLWVGGKGVFTPTHHDLTNNFIVQISGRKRWWVAPTSDMIYMHNHNHVYSYIDPRKKMDLSKFPNADKIRWMQFDMEPGDFLFLGEGNWHCVESLEENVTVTGTCFHNTIKHFTR